MWELGFVPFQTSRGFMRGDIALWRQSLWVEGGDPGGWPLPSCTSRKVVLDYVSIRPYGPAIK